VIRITLDGQGKAVIEGPAKGDGFFIRGKDVTIKGFTISAGRDGIHLSGAAGGAAATIEGNVIRKTGRHGIHMDHSGVSRIAGNTIEDVPGFGIDVGESSVARIGYLLRPLGRAANTIRRCGEHGIAVTRASAARIVGNKIEGNGGSGIFVGRQSQADIFGNSISGNGANGITASQNSGVNLGNEDGMFDLGPNDTNPASKNAGYGLSVSTGGYADGPIGSLDGTRGAKNIDQTSVDCVT
ncbi:MAG TPA: right-handed parallel beta-helix repeat-containing protein, partial [Sinorhizobium sp.]|nr:right-handed parallel beta-helix repeat-containing protein [Sinorhizobium sp.]